MPDLRYARLSDRGRLIGSAHILDRADVMHTPHGEIEPALCRFAPGDWRTLDTAPVDTRREVVQGGRPVPVCSGCIRRLIERGEHNGNQG